MSAHESNVQPSIEIILFLLSSILKTFLNRILIKSCAIGNYRCKIPNRIFAPNIESFHKLLTSNNDVIINGEEDFRLGLFRYVITPIHGVVLRPIEVERYFPVLSVIKNSHFFHRFFVIPDDTDLVDDGTLHISVSFEILHEL